MGRVRPSLPNERRQTQPSQGQRLRCRPTSPLPHMTCLGSSVRRTNTATHLHSVVPKTVFVEPFLQVCCKQLTLVTNTIFCRFFVSCGAHRVVSRERKWYHCSAKPQDPRKLHSPKEHVEGVIDADKVQTSHSTFHISWYIWSLISIECCLREG